VRGVRERRVGDKFTCSKKKRRGRSWLTHALPHSVRTGYPHTPTQGNTTTLKRRQGAHAPHVKWGKDRLVCRRALGCEWKGKDRHKFDIRCGHGHLAIYEL
jgi:hypothetical protein